jgi:CRP-like cAMP-binding protein
MLTANSQVLEKDQWELERERRLHFFGKGQIIPLLPQGIWQVHQGLIQLTMLSASGDEVLLGWAGEGHFFGLWLTILQAYNATAVSNVHLKWFSVKEIEGSPRISQIIALQLKQRIQQSEALLAIAGQRHVEERLKQLLLLLKQEMGQPVPGGTRLNIRLTHQHIASAISTTRVTITRLLSKLQQQGWIILDRDRHIVIPSTIQEIPLVRNSI